MDLAAISLGLFGATALVEALARPVLGTTERSGNLPAIIENHSWDQNPILWKDKDIFQLRGYLSDKMKRHTPPFFT
jgi:hypothetical protein